MTNDYIALESCRARGLYVLNSRNLALGVFDGRHGFVGIRNKMGNRFLFTEYHWDTGPPHGTVKPVEMVGALPDEIDIREYGPLRCSLCGSSVTRAEPPDTGWKHALSTNECPQLHLSLEVYRPLFVWLESHEAAVHN